jgi:hypothetical protein
MSATYPVGSTSFYGETLALSTALASLGIPKGYQEAIIFAPSSDFRLAINPSLIDAVFYDESASEGSEYKRTGSGGIELVQDLTDRTHVGAAGTGTLLDSATTSDFLYLCFAEPIGGLRVTIGAANGSSATVAATYRKNDDTWANLSPTDGTASGATLAQTGSITWSAVTDWKAAQLVGAQGIVTTESEHPTAKGFWMRITWSGALDSDTEISDIWALNDATTRGYFQKDTNYGLSFDRRVVGAIEAVLASSTDTMQITWTKH